MGIDLEVPQINFKVNDANTNANTNTHLADEKGRFLLQVQNEKLVELAHNIE